MSPQEEKMESADTFNEQALEEGIVPPVSGNTPSGMKQRLSVNSKTYDLDGDGKLDSIEMKMRDMDASNRGHLKNEAVYKILQEQMQTQKELFNMKKYVMVLFAFTVILALSNLGTAWAAARLAKDTEMDGAQLVNKETRETVVTESKGKIFSVGHEESSRRGLDGEDIPLPDAEDCVGNTDYGSLSHATAVDMREACEDGVSASLSYVCPGECNDFINTVPVCGTGAGWRFSTNNGNGPLWMEFVNINNPSNVIRVASRDNKCSSRDGSCPLEAFHLCNAQIQPVPPA